MGLLALELNDAGIMAAAKEPPELLHVDGDDRETPGFALPDKEGLLVGKAAEGKAHLHPLQIYNSYWDQLNTEPLERPNIYAQNHAEIAYAHLSHIWKNIKDHGDEVVMAVPGFLQKAQLGLILGITEALSIPLKGMIALSVAAASKHCPGRMLLHLDMHLHRAEISLLEQGDYLTQKASITLKDRGLHHLRAEWIKAIAREFVRTTRYDPLHKASSEQELYNRLPGVLAALQRKASEMFEMEVGSETYCVKLTRDLFTRKAKGVFQEIGQRVVEMWERHRQPEEPMTLQMTHRVSGLPGCKEMLTGIADTNNVDLEPGSAAFGALQVPYEPTGREVRGAVSFLKSRPWQQRKRPSIDSHVEEHPLPHRITHPTHLLYRAVAYPISDRSLIIGSGSGQEGVDVRIEGELAGVSRKHCSLHLRGKKVVLTDHSTYGTFVDDVKISGTVVLRLGQIVRVGTPGETLQLIASTENDKS